MYSQSRILKPLTFLIGLLALAANPLLAETYACSYEQDMLPAVTFSYDDHNGLVIEQFLDGELPNDMGVGEISIEGGVLDFTLDYWFEGYVEERLFYTITFDTGEAWASNNFYNKDDTLSARGIIAEGSCTTSDDNYASASSGVSKPGKGGSQPVITPTASDLSCAFRDVETQVFKSASWCTSSMLKTDENNFGPENFLNDSVWCEGVDGYGIGETIEISYEKYPSDSRNPAFSAIFLANGDDSSAANYISYSRVKTILVETDLGDRWTLDVKDERGYQSISFGQEIAPKWFRITILDVYPGQYYEDTCISYVGADFGT